MVSSVLLSVSFTSRSKTIGKAIGGIMMNKKIILLQVILGIVGGSLFFWTTMYKEVDIFYFIHFLILFIILTVISLVLWKYTFFASYTITLWLLLYFFLGMVDITDDSDWMYILFIMLPIGLIFLGFIVVIELMFKGIKEINNKKY